MYPVTIYEILSLSALREHASHFDTLLVAAIGSATSSGVWVAGSTGTAVIFVKQHINQTYNTRWSEWCGSTTKEKKKITPQGKW